MAKIRNFILRLLKTLLAPLQEAFIPLKDLPPALRLLSWLGYLSILFMLLMLVASAIWGRNWSLATFTFDGDPLQVPAAVQFAGLVGLFISWVYLLTGATESHPLIFLPLSLLFCLEMAYLGTTGNLFVAWLCSIVPATGVVSLTHLFTYKKAFWRKYPLVVFLIWTLLILLDGGLFWLGRKGGAGFGDSVATILDPFFFLLSPLWLLFGLSVVDLAVNLARWAVTSLRKLFPAPVLQALALFVLITRLAVIPLLLALMPSVEPILQRPDFGLEDIILPAAMLLDTYTSVPLVIAALVIAFRHRWDTHHAAQLLALCLASPVFALGLILALSGRGDISNPLEMTLSSLGALPSVIVFVVMLTYNVLGVGTKFARTEGRLMPRHGRILLVFGVSQLVASLATYRVNLLEVATRLPADNFVEGFGNIFAASLSFLGLPYLLWIIWKRPQRLAGNREEFEALQARFHFLDRFGPRAWVMAGTVSGTFLCMLACLGALVSFYF